MILSGTIAVQLQGLVTVTDCAAAVTVSGPAGVITGVPHVKPPCGQACCGGGPGGFSLMLQIALTGGVNTPLAPAAMVTDALDVPSGLQPELIV